METEATAHGTFWVETKQGGGVEVGFGFTSTTNPTKALENATTA
jgi:hypothetical protein